MCPCVCVVCGVRGWPQGHGLGGDVAPVFVPLHYVLVVEIEQENLTNIDLL